MIAEMHCHTSEHSACSNVAAIDLVTRAHQGGLQALVITDHHYQWTEDELHELRRAAGLPHIFRLFAGQEVNTADYGHVLVYGADKTLEEQDISLAEIRRAYPDAALVWAHPYRDGRIPSAEKLLSPLHDAIEIFNSNYSLAESARSLRDWHRYRFTATGGTDTHAINYIGMYPTIFDHPVSTLAEMIEEIKKGRCHPYFKEIPFSGTTNTEITELTVGPKSTQTRRKIILKKFENPESWREGERTFHIIEELRRHGFDQGPYHVPHPLDKDEELLMLMEEKVTGCSLHQCLREADPGGAPRYLRMAAEWLAKLHNAALHLTPAREYLEIEPGRLDYYLSSLVRGNHRFLDRVREIKSRVLELEEQLLTARPELLVQGHGDFHPKNIYIGREEEEGCDCICAIDFNSSYQLPRAFDVGTFLAQYLNMFFEYTELRRDEIADVFLNTYLGKAEHLESDFQLHVNLYRARTCLSILYYLVKVGLGDSANFWRIMIEAEKNLNSIHTRRIRQNI